MQIDGCFDMFCLCRRQVTGELVCWRMPHLHSVQSSRVGTCEVWLLRCEPSYITVMMYWNLTPLVCSFSIWSSSLSHATVIFELRELNRHIGKDNEPGLFHYFSPHVSNQYSPSFYSTFSPSYLNQGSSTHTSRLLISNLEQLIAALYNPIPMEWWSLIELLVKILVSY